jgi:hypothetical protein
MVWVAGAVLPLVVVKQSKQIRKGWVGAVVLLFALAMRIR